MLLVSRYDVNQTAENLGLDILAIAGLALIWKRDTDGLSQGPFSPVTALSSYNT